MSQSYQDSNNKTDTKIGGDVVSQNLGVSDAAGAITAFGNLQINELSVDVVNRAIDFLKDLAKDSSLLTGGALKEVLDQGKNALTTVQNNAQGAIDALGRELTTAKSNSSEDLVKAVAQYAALGAVAVFLALYLLNGKK